jgi:hypothetical protein
MGAMTKNGNFFNWPNLLYFKAVMAAIMETGRR